MSQLTEEKAGRLVLALKQKQLHISTAESCTGGLIASALTEVSGASEVFELGVVSYSNGIKNRVLQVAQQTLDTYTVYSAQVAEEMVSGVLKLGGADLAVAVTGVAGPGGGTPEKPVGLVYIAVGSNQSVMVRKYHFQGERSHIRRQTLDQALTLALQFVEKLDK